MIRTVLFDFFGTVARPTEWSDTPETVLARWGYALSDSVVNSWKIENEVGVEHAASSSRRHTYMEWERRRLAAVADASGVPANRIDAVVVEMYAARRPTKLEPYPECRGVLAELRALGLQVGLCSNWDWDLAQMVRDSGLGDAFDVIVSSARAGARKPHPLIYHYALEQCRVRAHEAIFVGDTLVADVIGPVRAGMSAVWLTRTDPAVWRGVGVAPSPPVGRAITPSVAQIADLKEMVPLVRDSLHPGSRI